LFDAEGVRPMESLARPYDPNRHEVLGAVKTADSPAGFIVEELQRGYLLGERVLRPARVRIAEPSDAPRRRDRMAPRLGGRRAEASLSGAVGLRRNNRFRAKTRRRKEGLRPRPIEGSGRGCR